MDFDVHLTHQDQWALLGVHGEIDVVSRQRFEKAMFDVLDTDATLVVDMRRVTFCDSTGLNAIVAANRRARERGVVMALIELPERVQRVFRITGIDNFVPVYDTLHEALNALPSAPPTPTP